MKRSMLLGMLALALPGAGCATLSHLDPVSTNSGAAAKSSAVAGTPGADVDFAAYMAQAQQARMAGDTATAIKLLSQLVLVAPDDPRVVGEYGKALVAANRSDDAIAFLQRAIQLQPGDWTLYSAQGVAYDQKGEFPQAQSAYARALELKPGEAAVLNNDALSHMQAGDLAGAEILLRQISPKSPGYERVAKNLALVESLKAPMMPPQASAQLARNTPPANTPPVKTAGAPPVQIPSQPAMMPMPPSDSASPQTASAGPAMLPGVQDFQPMPQEPVTVAPIDQPADMMVASMMPPAPEPQPMSPPRQLTGIDALRTDPSVVVQPLPKGPERAMPQPEPQPASPPRTLTGLDALKNDPRVVVQPLPKERETQPTAAPQPIPASLTQPPMPETKPKPVQKARVADASGATAGGHVYVQAGAFFSEARARQAAAGLESMDVKIMTGTVNGREVFRVRIGPFTTVDQAKAAYAQVQARGHNDLIIVKE